MRVRWLEGAKQQLLSEVLGQLTVKERRELEQAVRAATENLEQFPEIGKMRDPPREDIRVLWVREYRLTYLLDYEQDEVLIFSFVLGRRKGDALD